MCCAGPKKIGTQVDWTSGGIQNVNRLMQLPKQQDSIFHESFRVEHAAPVGHDLLSDMT